VSETDRKLARLLRAAPGKLDPLSKLSEEDRARLASDIERAHQHHSTHIRRAMAEALNHLPWILRGPVKKIFR
jgi:hypothetical protein